MALPQAHRSSAAASSASASRHSSVGSAGGMRPRGSHGGSVRSAAGRTLSEASANAAAVQAVLDAAAAQAAGAGAGAPPPPADCEHVNYLGVAGGSGLGSRAASRSSVRSLQLSRGGSGHTLAREGSLRSRSSQNVGGGGGGLTASAQLSAAAASLQDAASAASAALLRSASTGNVKRGGSTSGVGSSPGEDAGLSFKPLRSAQSWAVGRSQGGSDAPSAASSFSKMHAAKRQASNASGLQPLNRRGSFAQVTGATTATLKELSPPRPGGTPEVTGIAPAAGSVVLADATLLDAEPQPTYPLAPAAAAADPAGLHDIASWRASENSDEQGHIVTPSAHPIADSAEHTHTEGAAYFVPDAVEHWVEAPEDATGEGPVHTHDDADDPPTRLSDASPTPADDGNEPIATGDTARAPTAALLPPPQQPQAAAGEPPAAATAASSASAAAADEAHCALDGDGDHPRTADDAAAAVAAAAAAVQAMKHIAVGGAQGVLDALAGETQAADDTDMAAQSEEEEVRVSYPIGPDVEGEAADAKSTTNGGGDGGGTSVNDTPPPAGASDVGADLDLATAMCRLGAKHREIESAIDRLSRSRSPQRRPPTPEMHAGMPPPPLHQAPGHPPQEQQVRYEMYNNAPGRPGFIAHPQRVGGDSPQYLSAGDPSASAHSGLSQAWPGMARGRSAESLPGAAPSQYQPSVYTFSRHPTAQQLVDPPSSSAAHSQPTESPEPHHPTARAGRAWAPPSYSGIAAAMAAASGHDLLQRTPTTAAGGTTAPGESAFTQRDAPSASGGGHSTGTGSASAAATPEGTKSSVGRTTASVTASVQEASNTVPAVASPLQLFPFAPPALVIEKQASPRAGKEAVLLSAPGSLSASNPRSSRGSDGGGVNPLLELVQQLTSALGEVSAERDRLKAQVEAAEPPLTARTEPAMDATAVAAAAPAAEESDSRASPCGDVPDGGLAGPEEHVSSGGGAGGVVTAPGWDIGKAWLHIAHGELAHLSVDAHPQAQHALNLAHVAWDNVHAALLNVAQTLPLAQRSTFFASLAATDALQSMQQQSVHHHHAGAPVSAATPVSKASSASSVNHAGHSRKVSISFADPVAFDAEDTAAAPSAPASEPLPSALAAQVRDAEALRAEVKHQRETVSALKRRETVLKQTATTALEGRRAAEALAQSVEGERRGLATRLSRLRGEHEALQAQHEAMTKKAAEAGALRGMLEEAKTHIARQMASQRPPASPQSAPQRVVHLAPHSLQPQQPVSLAPAYASTALSNHPSRTLGAMDPMDTVHILHERFAPGGAGGRR